MTLQKLPTMASPQDSPSEATATKIPEHLIKPWKLPPQTVYCFKNANVVDPVSGSFLPNQRVKISKGRIDFVGKTLFYPASDNVVVVDLEGKFLCPGLIDCHMHLASVAGDEGLMGSMYASDVAISHFRQPFLCQQVLSRGFTTVRDTGGATLALKEAIEDDVFPGPRIFLSVKALSQTGGHGDLRGQHDFECCASKGGITLVVDGVSECIRATREQLRTGADFIKILIGGGVASPTDRLENTQFTAAEVRAITEVAESFGTYVTAHAYTPKAIRHAVENGVKGIEHGNMIDKETAEYMAARGIWLTPTLVTYDAMGSSKYAGFLPPANQAKNRQVLAHGLNSLKIAHAAGVTICHGSDLLGPLQAEQSREFEIRTQALGNNAILKGATVNAAKMLGQENFLGQVKEGFAADMLVLDTNPLRDLSILSEPEKHVLAVIKNGRVYKSRWSGLPEDVTPPEPVFV